MNHKPLAELTLRRYEKPYRLQGRELVKRLCLSLGLLQTNDGRDVMVDVFHSIVKAKEPITQQEIERFVKDTRTANNLGERGSAPSNIRRQVKRLRDLFLIERTGSKYHLAEHGALHEVFTERIEKVYLPAILTRVKEYCEAVEKERHKE